MRAEDCVVSKCPRKASGRIPMVPMCAYHGLQIGLLFRDDVLALAQREQADKEYARTEANAAKRGNREGELVYYVRIGGYVKIGYSARLRNRYASLRADELLAVEPGGRDLESHRHSQFAAERIDLRRENFRPSARLQEHISEIHAHYGLPHWATVPRTTVVTAKPRPPKETP